MGHSLYLPSVLKASPGAAIFGRDMLFDIPFIADWKKIGEHRQLLTDCNTARENEGQIDYDYQVEQKVLVRNDGTKLNHKSGQNAAISSKMGLRPCLKLQNGLYGWC
jgi:hypothetical protein